MPPKIGIIACETLRREIAAALEGDGFSDVQLSTFAFDCSRPTNQRERLDGIIRACASQCDHVLLIGGPCMQEIRSPALAEVQAKVSCLDRCFDLFLPAPLIQQYLRHGAYLLTPGWLATWQRRMDNWGFDQATARAFFAESCSRLVLLDTGVDAQSPAHLAELAAFVDRPMEVVPTNVDQLRLTLCQHIQDWRQQQLPTTGPVAVNPTVADYAMVLDVLGRVAGYKTEAEVIRAIFELCDMLCAPRRLAWLPLTNGQPGPALCSPAAGHLDAGVLQAMRELRSDSATASPGVGFMLRLRRESEPLGVLLVAEVALPQHQAHYLNLFRSVQPALALAVASARNIEHLHQAAARLAETVREKEALMKEVHHRVKNNLQVISSLMRLQTAQLQNPEARTVLKDMQERIRSMALLHETLYRSGNLAQVDARAYLRSLCTQLSRALTGPSTAVRLDVDIAPVLFHVDQAVPCGLLVNELVSNACKHAFPEGRAGEIRVELQPVDGGPELCLRVTDNGIGLPPDFEIRDLHSLGLQLVSDLTGQLHGNLRLGKAPGGAVFEVFFTPAPLPAKALPSVGVM